MSDLVYSPDGATLAAVGGDWRLRLLDLRTGKEWGPAGEPRGQTTHLAFSPADGQIALARDGRIELWSGATGERPQILGDHGGGIDCLAFSSDGTLLASAGADWLIRLWDVREGRLKGRLSGHTATVKSLAFAPDGRSLASGGDDRTVRLWYLPTLQELYSLEGHRGAVSAVAFSPDGRLLASGGTIGPGEGDAYLWRAK